MLDPARWQNPDTYLQGDLTLRLVEIEAQCQLTRAAYVAARLELARQEDEQRIARWEESVAAQQRAISIETRAQHNIVEQTEADLQQLLSEREILMFVIGH